MSEQQHLQSARISLLLNCSDDDVGLWEVRNSARRVRPNASEAELRELTLSLVRPLLAEGLIHAGFPALVYFHPSLHEEMRRKWGALDPAERFVVSRLPVPELLEQIERDWVALGRAPNLGDVIWFTATPLGLRVAIALTDLPNRHP